MNKLFMETNWDKAFDLAYFILGDRAFALAVTISALLLCPTSILHKRRKRLEYRLKGRLIEGSWMKPFRTKLMPNQSQELQSLVYAESARYEEMQERGNGDLKLSDEDFIVRYVKHLVFLATRLSSFYVSLGLNRLLFDYGTKGSMDIYQTVMQDIERQKEQRYYGKQRLLLMKRLSERFGECLRTEEHRNREMSFVRRRDSERWFLLVAEALNRFTPWETACALPETFHSIEDPIPRLAFGGSTPEREHPIEALRMHALMHSPCFERLTAALGLAAPKQALQLPQFVRNNKHEVKPTDRRGGGLRPDEREEVRRVLRQEERRRKNAAPEFVRVKVDGTERGRVRLNGTEPCSFEVDQATSFLQIVTEDETGDIVLGNLLFASRQLPPAGQTEDYCISLVRGRELRVGVTTRADEEGEYAGSALTLEYREREWAALLSKLGAHWSTLTGLPRRPWTWSGVARVSAGLASVIVLVSFGLFLAYQRRQPPTDLVARVEAPLPEASNTPVESPTTGPTPQVVEQPVTQGVTPRPAAGRSPVRQGGSHAEGARSLSPENRERLSEIKRIYVEDHPDSAIDGQIRAAFIRQLSASGRFAVVDEPQQADGFLIWSLTRRLKSDSPLRKHGSRKQLSLVLTNKHRRALWRGTTRSRDESQTEDALVSELLSKLPPAAPQ